MLKRLFSFILVFLLSNAAFGQEKFAGHLNVGYLTPLMDLSDNNLDRLKPNLAVDLGLSYQIYPLLRLRGNLAAGIMNADNGTSFFETNILEPSASLDLDVLQLFKAKSQLKLYGTAGVGMLFYSGRVFNISSNALESQSPPPSDQKGLSPTGIGIGGFSLEYPLNDRLSLAGGYTLRIPLLNDWLDGTEQGQGDDYYGMATLGLVFKMGHSIPKGSVAVEESKYEALNQKVQSLQKKNSQLQDQQENLAQLEMAAQEKDLKIAQLKAQNDSLELALNSVDVVKERSTTTDNTTGSSLREDYGEPAYRIIVMSMPSEALAQKWIDRAKIESDEMFIAYNEKVNTYRVVYKSFATYEAAKKELQGVKMAVPDAWIIKF